MVTFILTERGAAYFGPKPSIGLRELNDLTRELKLGLGRLVDGKPWRVQFRFEAYLVLRQASKTFPRIASSAQCAWEVKTPDPARNFLHSFTLTAIDRIRAESQWIARCRLESCKQLFVRNDLRQLYCSNRHSQTQRTRDSRRKAAEGNATKHSVTPYPSHVTEVSPAKRRKSGTKSS
jgi:hypothetical protein